MPNQDTPQFARKALSAMREWKRTLADRTALLVEGARRVGKTSLVRRFAESEYESCLFIDFSEPGRAVRDAKRAFLEAENVADLLTRLQLVFATRLHPGRSCVVFDEVQLFPKAREAIKHLVAHGRYHYMETGSLVGIKENVKDILVPSEEHPLALHPLDFEEFLDAVGASVVKDALRGRFAERRALGSGALAKALDLFRQYMVTGGMPQSVAALVAGGDRALEAGEAAKREILRLYEADIGKYAHGYASKVRAVFRTIPAALARHEKKFRLADIDPGARMRRYENAFLWLADAKVANLALNATSPDLGLEASVDDSALKCYLFDTGLLLTMAMGGGRRIDPRVLRGVRYDNFGLNEGMFFENAVAQAIVAGGQELRFYSRRGTGAGDPDVEVDFLVRRGIKICPVEVKSGAFRRHASLDRFSERFRRHLGESFVVCRGDVLVEGRTTYIPVCMAHLLAE